MAQETVFALRQKIAKIEGRLAERLDGPAATAGEAAGVVLRRHGIAPRRRILSADGIDALDQALGGGLPKAALTEIHGAETRDAGAVAGFALALVSAAS